MRRQKYKAVDLGKQGSGAADFQRAQQDDDLDFVEMPLKDVVDYLRNMHNIPIVLATKKLEEASVSPDTPVTKTLRGITLRSALRLIFKDLELTYVVRERSSADHHARRRRKPAHHQGLSGGRPVFPIIHGRWRHVAAA